LPMRMWLEARAKAMADIGEPWISFFDPADIAAELTRLGFSRLEDLGGEAMNARYFAGRADGLKFGPSAHVMRATV
jgi:O-methyltransferase involved in polyketide biosynthesis